MTSTAVCPQLTLESARRLQEEEGRKRKAAEGTAYPFKGPCDSKTLGSSGVVYAVATENGTQLYANPHDKGHVKVKMSSVLGGKPSCVVGNGRPSGLCCTHAIPQSSVTIDFKAWRVADIEKYVIRHGNSGGGYKRLKSWVLEASVNAKDWVVIDRQDHDRSPLPDAAFSTAAFPLGDEKLVVVKQEGGFRYIKLTQTGKNSGGSNGPNDKLYLAGIVFNGSLLPPPAGGAE